MSKKSLLITMMLLAITIATAGCGTQQSNSLSKIKSAGVIKVGTEGTYAPFTFHDSKGNITGFDVDITKEIARRLGVKAEFVETKWDGMFAGLDANRFDIVANEVGINADRQAKYDFSSPYIVSKAVLVVRSDDNSIKSFKDLKGKKAAQTLTSNYGKIATSYGAEIVQVDGFNSSIDLLTSKRVEASVNDSLSYLDLKKQKPNSPVKVAATYTNADKSAILFKKGNKELVSAVNKALAGMKSDGTYLKISNKWFGTDVSK